MTVMTKDLAEKESVLFSLIMDNIDEGVLILSKEGEVLAANQTAKEILNSHIQEIIDKNFIEQLSEESQEKFLGVLKVGKSRADYLLKVQGKEGKEIFLTSNILFGDDSVLLIFKDLSDIQEMESYVKHLDKLAMIGQLAAGIAHEIRNPLAGISTTAQVLRGKIDSSKREFIDVILSEINRLDNIVRELLDFARPVNTYIQSCNINAVIEKMLVLVEAQFSKAKIKVKREYVENTSAFLNADSEQLMQAFLNIILNAIAAMPKGGELTIRTSATADVLQIQFTDTGCGISSEKKEDLFKPFFTTKTRGMGLGLTVTKKIIQQHKGEIEVKSREGEGSSFFIKIPKKG